MTATPPEKLAEALAVAREHGTIVAAEFSGLLPDVIRRYRRRVDGYQRGPGAPSTAELAERAARLDCPCPRCTALRSDEATRSSHAHRATEPRGDHSGPVAWKTLAACRGVGPDRFFLDVYDHEGKAAAKALCAVCPVAADCLEFALVNGYTEGIWGGHDLTEPGRHKRLERLRRYRERTDPR